MSTILPASALVDDRFVSATAGSESTAWLDRVGVTDYVTDWTDEGLGLRLSVVPLDEGGIAEGIPLLSLAGFDLLLGPWGAGNALTMEMVGVGNRLTVSMSAPLSLRLGPPTLRRVSPSTLEPLEDDPTVVVPLGEPELSVTFTVADGDLDVEFSVDTGGTPLSIPPVMIGDTGVVVEATDVSLNLSGDDPTSTPSNAPDDWRGVYIESANVYVPDAMDGHVSATDLGIGTGGLTGTISAHPALSYDEATGEFDGDVAGELLGLSGGVSEVSLTFVQSVPAGGSIVGQLLLPFFEKRVGVELSMDVDGGFTAGLTGVPGGGNYDDSTGLLHLERDMFTLDVAALTFEVDNEVAVVLDGQIEPTVGLDLPPIDLQGLRIDSNGNVSLPGGWLDLDDQYVATIGGFEFEITKFGMGNTDDGRKWVGFNGGIKLLEGIPAGASVEGLRIVWDEADPTDFDVSLDGVGVEFEVPGTVKFKGEVSFGDDQFRGDIDLELIALDTTVDAEVVFGEATRDDESFRYMGVYIDANLPAGIPLWATGLSLYGIAGLFASQMEPDKAADEKWYSVDHGESWFHRPPKGITGLTKWRPTAGAVGFGAGVDVATAPDNGLAVASDLTLVMVFPGPIIMLQGRAELLEEGAAVDEEAPFQTLAILDNRAGSFTLGIDARYDERPLLDIAASVEAFYSFSDPDAWYLNLGRKEPRDQRIRARALSIFTVDAYFMLNAHRLATGVWAGYDRSWSFGPLSVSLAAWISSDVIVNFEPAHFYGTVNLHGEVALKAFGVGLGLTVDAGIEADVFDPFHLLGRFRVKLNLPWPLPDPSAKVTLEWGPEPTPPTLPDPLEDVGIAHEKLASTWAGETVHETTATSPSAISAPTDAPADDATVVPLDARPQITFSRPVHNVSGVADDRNPPDPAREVIGDPAKNEGPVDVRYELARLRLLRWDGSSWLESDPLEGVWAPLPQQPKQGSDGGAGGQPSAMTQSKLLVNARTPYAYDRFAGGAWEDAIDRWFPSFPCETDHRCYDFDGLSYPPDFRHDRLWSDGTIYNRYQRRTHAEDSWLRFYLEDEGESTPSVAVESTAGPGGAERALVVIEGVRQEEGEEEESGFAHRLQIHLPTSFRSVTLRIRARKYFTEGRITARDSEGNVHEDGWRLQGGDEERFVMTGDEDGTVRILDLEFDGSLAVVEVCGAAVDLSVPGVDLEAGVEELRAQLARWADAGAVLEPYSAYRLEVVTRRHARGRGDFAAFEDETFLARYVEFQTEGPPGLSTPSPPASAGDQAVGSGGADTKESTGLETLARYVHQTTPATVPAEGELPPLPRPVYRADPVGVSFNADYVDLLYRLANRDLTLQLFDANDRPVRDVRGRLLVGENPWGETESMLLDRATRRWFTRIDDSPCLDLDDLSISRTRQIERPSNERVLDPDTVHEARLTPLLLREAWAGPTGSTRRWAGEAGSWQTVDEWHGTSDWAIEGHAAFEGNDAVWLAGERVSFVDGDFVSELEPLRDTISFTTGGSTETYTIVGIDPTNDAVTLDRTPGLLGGSRYRVPARYEVRQRVRAGQPNRDADGTVWMLAANPDLPGTHDDQPDGWTDVRASATIGTNSSAPGVIGLVFRRRASTHYRFEMSAVEDYRRLVRVESGRIVESWEIDDAGYQPGLDHFVTVEAIGDKIRVLVDDEPVLRVTDPDGPDAGTVGLYCRATDGFRCGAIRVDDFRDGPPVAYRFSFTTSAFVDAHHHVHSFDDEIWVDDLAAAVLPASDVWVPLNGWNGLDESTCVRVERAFANVASTTGATSLPERLEVTRFEGDGTTTGLLVRSPEPIDLSTTRLTVERGPFFDDRPRLPESLKLTGVEFGSVPKLSALLRETADLSGYSIDYRRGTGGGFAPTLGGEVFDDSFEDPAALDAYDVVNEGSWSVAEGALTVDGNGPEADGWQAAVRKGAVADAGVVSATVTPGEDAAAVGIAFRYRNVDDHYALTVSSDGTRLIRVRGDSRETLWHGNRGVTTDEPAALRLVAAAGMLRGFLDDVPLFAVTDPEPAVDGAVGVVATGAAAVEHLALHGTAIEGTLLSAPFDSPRPEDWSFVKEPPYSIRTPDWTFEAGELRQRSNIYGFVGGRYAEPGTYGVVGDRSWQDYRTIVRLRSDDNDAIGVIVRYQNDGTYYRFSMDADREYRRLIRKDGDGAVLLWEDETGFETGTEYLVTVECVGDRLVGYLDGEQLFEVTDDAIAAGAVGVYCRANRGARFLDLSVDAPTDVWVPYHTFEEGSPLPAGTRMEVADAPVAATEEPRFERYERNGPPVTIPPDAVHFRVRSPDDVVGHARQFRSPSSYEAVGGLSALWSADGTGLLLLRTGGFDPGQYRLTIAPDSDESPLDRPVVIDVPWDRGDR